MCTVSRVRSRGRANDAALVPIPQRVLIFAHMKGMHIVQIYAQRLYGPPYHYPHWEPEYGSEVFIGKIPRTFQEPELMPYLERAGPVYQLRLMMDFSGGTNKGFCFVRYFSAAQADGAVNLLNGLRLQRGHSIFAMKSVDNRNLLLSGIPTCRTYKEITDRISSISEGVIFVYPLWQVPCFHHRGLAIVTYSSHRLAALARKRMIGKPVYFWEYQVSVDWAEPDTSLNGVGQVFSNMPQVLRVRNIPKGTRIPAVRHMFNEHSFGGVKKLRVKKYQMYIFFRSRIQGEVAKLALDGAVLGDKIIQVDWIDPRDVPPSRRQRLHKKKQHAQERQQKEQEKLEGQQKLEIKEQQEQSTEVVAEPSNCTAIVLYKNVTV